MGDVFIVDKVSNEPLTAEEIFGLSGFNKTVNEGNNNIVFERSSYISNTNNANFYYTKIKTEIIYFKDRCVIFHSTASDDIKIDGMLLSAINKQMEELKWM